MAEKAIKADAKESAARGKQLQATVSQEVYAAFDEHHWDARKPLVDVTRQALIEYGQRNGFLDQDGNPVKKEA